MNKRMNEKLSSLLHQVIHTGSESLVLDVSLFVAWDDSQTLLG